MAASSSLELIVPSSSSLLDTLFQPAKPMSPLPHSRRNLRVLFTKQLSDSDASRGQDRLLLGKRSQGCLGMENSPSAPDWQDVALVFHDEEEPGRKKWSLLHGLWPSTKAFVLKGREWGKFREYKRLQAKDILTISVDEADGSLWISHSPTAAAAAAPTQVVQQPPQQQRKETLALFPLSPDLQSPPPFHLHAKRRRPPPAPPTPPTPSAIHIDLTLGFPSPSDYYCPPPKRQRQISPSSPAPSSSSAPTSSSTASVVTTSPCNSTFITNATTSDDRSTSSDGSLGSVVDQGTSTLLALGRRLAKNCLSATLGDRSPAATDRKLRVLFVKHLTDKDVLAGQDMLLLKGKGSYGRLGRDKTPSPPAWRDVALLVHDLEEMGRTWQLLHGFWLPSRAFVLKGQQWSEFRAHKQLQPKDILVISTDKADGSLWICHRRRFRL